MSTTKNEVIRKKPTARKSTKARSVGRPRKAAPLSVNRTLVTIHPDGIITVEKTEETVTEQVMTKGGA
jgi:hypothetical protein